MNGSLLQMRRQRGAIAVVAGIALAVLVGMAGLVLDLAHLYIVKTELQNAADACALSAARELFAINATTLARATSAGMEAGKRNLVNFQSTAPDIQNADITFAPALDAAFARSVDANTQYVRCAPHEAQPISVVMWFMSLRGVQDRSVSADAVAKYPKGAPYCGVPLAACTDSAAAPNKGFAVGSWYSGRLEAGKAVQGNYGWIRFPDQDTGTSALADMVAGGGLCDLASATTVFQNSGVSNGAAKAWNTRFGLYGSPYKPDQQTLADHPPDTTGWSAQTNPDANKDGIGDGVIDQYRTNQAANTPYDPSMIVDGNNKPVAYPGTPAPISSGQHAAGQRDRRLVSMPVINCSAWSAKKEMEIIDWACSLMVAPMEDAQDEVRLEFRGLVSNGCGGAVGAAGFPKLVR